MRSRFAPFGKREHKPSALSNQSGRDGPGFSRLQAAQNESAIRGYLDIKAVSGLGSRQNHPFSRVGGRCHAWEYPTAAANFQAIIGQVKFAPCRKAVSGPSDRQTGRGLKISFGGKETQKMREIKNRLKFQI